MRDASPSPGDSRPRLRRSAQRWQRIMHLYRWSGVPRLAGLFPKWSILVWFFELKHDGFRALAFIENGKCQLVSRNGNEFKNFSALASALPKELSAGGAVLDGEIVCLDNQGRSQFNELLFGRGEPHFYAFD